MKITRQNIIGFLLLIIIASLYRIMPQRPFGFAPQIAMAIFAGSIVKNKKFSFILPLLCMFISDALYEVLYRNGVGNIKGFYDGQITNYVLFTLMTCFGFFIKIFNIVRISLASFAAPTVYFFLSNSLVWLSSSPDAGYNRPKTFTGYLQTLNDGIPFYEWSIVATFLFSAILFGSYYFITKKSLQTAHVAVTNVNG